MLSSAASAAAIAAAAMDGSKRIVALECFRACPGRPGWAGPFVVAGAFVSPPDAGMSLTMTEPVSVLIVLP